MTTVKAHQFRLALAELATLLRLICCLFLRQQTFGGTTAAKYRHSIGAFEWEISSCRICRVDQIVRASSGLAKSEMLCEPVGNT
jgi:hypothetical protein